MLMLLQAFGYILIGFVGGVAMSAYLASRTIRELRNEISDLRARTSRPVVPKRSTPQTQRA